MEDAIKIVLEELEFCRNSAKRAKPGGDAEFGYKMAAIACMRILDALGYDETIERIDE